MLILLLLILFFFKVETLKQQNQAGNKNSTTIILEFESLMTVCHYCGVRCACQGLQSLNQIAVKISIALLRYSDIIPADKAYYEAGVDARVCGRNLNLIKHILHVTHTYSHKQN